MLMKLLTKINPTQKFPSCKPPDTLGKIVGSRNLLTTEEMVPQQKYVLRLLHFAVAYRLFQDRLKPTGTPERATACDKAREFSRVRCPLCKWRPNASSRWYCGDCDYP